MPARVVCLANSFKEGGRCLAGIVIDANNNPVFENGRRKWIRPVCNTAHGEIHTDLVSHINLLDIIEIEITGQAKKGYQSENVWFDEKSIKVAGTFPKEHLNKFCEDRPTLFGNRGKAVSEENIGNLTYSLLFAKTNQFEVIAKTYEDTPDKKQVRLVFTYNSSQYDFPITDPDFLKKYRAKPDFINGVKEIFLTTSLGISWQNWYYKLVAGIIFP
jgi:hypothetical protein